MKIKASDLDLFKRLHIKNCIDLALILPKKIENLSLSVAPVKDQICTQEAEILRASFHSNKLLGVCYVRAWGCEVSFIIFHASKWHHAVFKKGASLTLNAKMSLYNGTWQFVNPKIIKQSGIFKPKYQLAGIKDESIQRLIFEYVSELNLSACGLSQKHIQLLLSLHRYDENSYHLYEHLDEVLKDLKFIEIFNFLKRLRSKSAVFKSYECEIYELWSWLESLPFKLTNDQLKAIEDIREDLRSSVAKRRVIMGDVGCGKTLVLLAAALSVYPKQALLMAPTSILASQLFNEARKFLPEFMKITFIKGGKKDKDLESELKEANLIIGTHALIHQQGFDAVLVMVDEQHRFGSNQRQKINELASKDEIKPHFIQFSATPIPRTLSMIQSELVNFSFIKQMPFKKDIQTFCVQEKDFAIIEAKIKQELDKNNQICIIYPIVNESEALPYMSLNEALPYWQKRYEGVYFTHGKDKNKDEVLLEFSQKGQILLSTTVVEVGISLPRLSVMIIVGAERLGLATLHQLRGRVGRVGLESFCYLYTKQKQVPQRLLDFSNTLDGFEIAELDLKNRLSGDLLDGFLQHGNEFKFFDFARDEAILQEARSSLEV